MNLNDTMQNLGVHTLSHAMLDGVNLKNAPLQFKSLRNTRLRGTDLRGADLRGSDLRGSDLRGSDLREALLYGADLRRADLDGAVLPHFQICPETGSFEAYKASKSHVLRLLIPADSARTSTLVGRKCRAEHVKVLEILSPETLRPAKCKSVHSWKGGEDFIYRLGETAYADKYDDDIRVECTHGIHFFMSDTEAVWWLDL